MAENFSFLVGVRYWEVSLYTGCPSKKKKKKIEIEIFILKITVCHKYNFT
jgi:hypothetical protein